MKKAFAPGFSAASLPPQPNRGGTAGGSQDPPLQNRSFGAWFLIFLIHLYRAVLSPLLGGNCKFYPSCSHYAEQAIAIHGARRGAWLALKRLLRCRPFVRGGFDPVPDRDEFDFHAPLHGQESAR